LCVYVYMCNDYDYWRGIYGVGYGLRYLCSVAVYGIWLYVPIPTKKALDGDACRQVEIY